MAFIAHASHEISEQAKKREICRLLTKFLQIVACRVAYPLEDKHCLVFPILLLFVVLQADVSRLS
jgi:hypothetical protein